MAPTVQKNKSHKTRFASKGQRHKHKVAKETVTTGQSGVHRPGKAASVNRAQRLQQAKAMRDHRRADALQEKRSGGSAGGAPKLIVLVSLSGAANISAIKAGLLQSALEGSHAKQPKDASAMEGLESASGDANPEGAISGLAGQVTFAVPKQKTRLTIIEAPETLLGCLDVVKVADIVAFVAPAEGAYIDEQGRELLTVLRALGLPATTGVIQGLEGVPLKRRNEAKKAAVASLQGQLGEDLKVHAADTAEDFKQLLRHLCELRLSPPVWRNHRPYVVADKIAFQPSDAASNGSGTLLVSGYLRARSLKAGQLIHVESLGDCHLAQIDGPEDPCPSGQHRHRAGGLMEVENEGGGARVLGRAGPDDFEPLIRENEPDPTAGEQTWPTEEELADAEEERRQRMEAKKQKKKVMKGTSAYQAAWIIDESDNEDEPDEDKGASNEDERMADAADVADDADVSDADNDVSDDEAGRGTTSGRTSEVWPGEDEDAMDEDEKMTSKQREEERRRLKEMAQGDEEFPDEVDTPMDVPARQRFAKYRGLKSFRTSPWDPKESLPREYARIFAFDNFRRTQKAVLAKQDEVDRNSLIVPGTYVRLHLVVSAEQMTSAQELVKKAENGTSGALTVIGLLQHETKMSVAHYSIKKSDSYSEPVKSKSELLFYTGLRTFKTRPIFSTDDLHMDKHKFERFLHPGRFSVATVFAPISFPPLPLLVFKEGVNGLELVATGAQREVDPDRVILKKIVISGYPYKVHKRKAVVRFMFFNPEDVRWFKPLELWTKYGRRGRIKEPVGTHGSMKCVFEGVVQQRDAVCATLYKRVYPRWPETP